jgi:hypothetical protein
MLAKLMTVPPRVNALQLAALLTDRPITVPEQLLVKYPELRDIAENRGQGHNGIDISDDKAKTRPEDASRVNVHEGYELKYWSQHFGVTPERLKEAVEKVGTSAKAVEAELKRR